MVLVGPHRTAGNLSQDDRCGPDKCFGLVDRQPTSDQKAPLKVGDCRPRCTTPYAVRHNVIKDELLHPLCSFPVATAVEHTAKRPVSDMPVLILHDYFR